MVTTRAVNTVARTNSRTVTAARRAGAWQGGREVRRRVVARRRGARGPRTRTRTRTRTGIRARALARILALARALPLASERHCELHDRRVEARRRRPRGRWPLGGRGLVESLGVLDAAATTAATAAAATAAASVAVADPDVIAAALALHPAALVATAAVSSLL